MEEDGRERRKTQVQQRELGRLQSRGELGIILEIV